MPSEQSGSIRVIRVIRNQSCCDRCAEQSGSIRKIREIRNQSFCDPAQKSNAKIPTRSKKRARPSINAYEVISQSAPAKDRFLH